MNSRFYVTAVVALLLAAAFNGAAKRPRQSPSGAGHSAEVESAQPSVPATARSLPPSQQAALPRS
jgi:hypothetical protein